MRRPRVVIDASRGRLSGVFTTRVRGRVAQRLALSQWIAPTAYGWRQTPSTQAVYARERK